MGGFTRAELVDEIKQINAERTKWPDIPLVEQIRTLEKEMVRLDHRVHHFEEIYTKTSIPNAIKKAIVDVIKFSKEILFTRILNREALKLSEQEYQTRMIRQNFRYHRSYRVGVHEQISTMKTRLNRLEEMTTSYKRYKGFVDSIEKALSDSPSIKFTETARSPDKVITTQEAIIKITLKAGLLREYVPDKFKPSVEKNIPKLSKTLDVHRPAESLTGIKPPPINATIEAFAEPQAIQITPPSRERKDWFFPANDAMRSFQQSIDEELKTRGHHVPMQEKLAGLQGEFISRVKPEKKATYEPVREKVRQEAEEKREDIPPQYKQEPYELETPKESKMSGAFNSASAVGNESKIFQKKQSPGKLDL